MKTIKQEHGSKDCMACVAAMITGTTTEQFKDFYEKNNLPFDCDFTFLRYLWENGYMTGSFFSTDAITSNIKMEDLSNVDLLKGDMYVVVESNNNDG